MQILALLSFNPENHAAIEDQFIISKMLRSGLFKIVIKILKNERLHRNLVKKKTQVNQEDNLWLKVWQPDRKYSEYLKYKKFMAMPEEKKENIDNVLDYIGEYEMDQLINMKIQDSKRKLKSIHDLRQEETAQAKIVQPKPWREPVTNTREHERNYDLTIAILTFLANLSVESYFMQELLGQGRGEMIKI